MSRVPRMVALNFRIGEKVVYPTHGVGIIEQIHCWPASGSSQKFYLLRIYSNSLRVMIPFSNAASVGLRRIVKSNEIERILHYLADGECLPEADWKCRFKENSEKMRSGSLLKVAEVLKCLLRVSKTKELSFRERKMLDRARYLLTSELAVVKNLNHPTAEAQLSKALSEAQLQFLPH
ncbi:MAG: CarD family transcriptional regulator [Acidobacteria bacterium]|nr:CarD family transcriptional regulator [Acidobacteriota bacterium]